MAQEAGTAGSCDTEFAKGVRDQCALLGFSLVADYSGLLLICLETVMELSRLQLQSETVSVDFRLRIYPTNLEGHRMP